MKKHPNKHIREAIEYTVEHGQKLPLGYLLMES